MARIGYSYVCFSFERRSFFTTSVVCASHFTATLQYLYIVLVRIFIINCFTTMKILGQRLLFFAFTVSRRSLSQFMPPFRAVSSISRCAATTVELPDREYRVKPLEWSELVNIIREGNLHLLSRSIEQETEYQIYRKNLKATWISVYDHILCSKFNFERHEDANGLFYAYPPLSEAKSVQTAVLRNDFPYYLAERIEHWILWKLGGDCDDQDIEDAKRQIQHELGDVDDFLQWINPPHLKSLPDIDHVHLLCKRG